MRLVQKKLTSNFSVRYYKGGKWRLNWPIWESKTTVICLVLFSGDRTDGRGPPAGTRSAGPLRAPPGPHLWLLADGNLHHNQHTVYQDLLLHNVRRAHRALCRSCDQCVMYAPLCLLPGCLDGPHLQQGMSVDVLQRVVHAITSKRFFWWRSHVSF